MKVRARDGNCRRREEEKARRERKWKKDMQVLEGILELKVANEVAEFAGQFFDFVEHGPQSPSLINIEMDFAEPTGSSDAQGLPGNYAEAFSFSFLDGASNAGPIYESE